MANDGTLNQRETGVGIFDEMTLQDNTPAGWAGRNLEDDEPGKKEEVSRQAHELAYGDNDNSPDVYHNVQTAEEAKEHTVTSYESVNDAGNDQVASERTLGMKAAAENAEITLAESDAEAIETKFTTGPYAEPPAGYNYQSETSQYSHLYDKPLDEKMTMEEWQADKAPQSEGYNYFDGQNTQSLEAGNDNSSTETSEGYDYKIDDQSAARDQLEEQVQFENELEVEQQSELEAGN